MNWNILKIWGNMGRKGRTDKEERDWELERFQMVEGIE